MIAHIQGCVVLGVGIVPVRVEVSVYPGMPGFSLVGLPSAAVRESRERVFSALRASGFQVPLMRMVVNLAPADLRKEGTQIDLPIALGILAASGQVEAEYFQGIMCAGELSLEGNVHAVSCIPAVGHYLASLPKPASGIFNQVLSQASLICPRANREQAEWFKGLSYCSLEHLKELHQYKNLPIYQAGGSLGKPVIHSEEHDLRDVQGQVFAKQSLLVAAAGGHSLLLAGSPGCGKSMLAHRMNGLLPDLTEAEALEVSVIQGMGSGDKAALMYRPPFRAPHHSASRAALIGGGSTPKPGEITLAHRGVLFLDELAEYDRLVLEALRQPLQDRYVELSRFGWQTSLPADFQLIAAFNPCPCGNLLDPQRSCRCTSLSVARYLGKVSGPLLDRVDIQIEMAAEQENLRDGCHDLDFTQVPQSSRQQNSVLPGLENLTSDEGRLYVREARQCALKRLEKLPFGSNEKITRNSQYQGRHVAYILEQHKSLAQDLAYRSRKNGWSLRARNSILKVALTLADLKGQDWPDAETVHVAAQMRALDLTSREMAQAQPYGMYKYEI